MSEVAIITITVPILHWAGGPPMREIIPINRVSIGIINTGTARTACGPPPQRQLRREPWHIRLLQLSSSLPRSHLQRPTLDAHSHNCIPPNRSLLYSALTSMWSIISSPLSARLKQPRYYDTLIALHGVLAFLNLGSMSKMLLFPLTV